MFSKIIFFLLILACLVIGAFSENQTHTDANLIESQGGVAANGHIFNDSEHNHLKKNTFTSLIWPAALFLISFLIGIIAAMAGVGGGVLFVPIVGSFFPFHMDFVRTTGLLLALSGSLASSPTLLRSGMVNLRIAMPLALVASTSAIIGATIGLMLPVNVVQTALGITILLIVIVMWKAKNSEYPNVDKSDALAVALRMNGIYLEESSGKEIEWRTHRTPLALFLFFMIGMLAGMFGLGAGWANVPVINQVMGAPLKVAVATSTFTLSIVDSAAAWIYINNGALIPMIAVPSLIGVMLGAKIGVKLLKISKPESIRKIVIALLIIAGTRALLRGLAIWN